MVVPLGPGKFYGSNLPRPRIYTDVKFNEDRIDPPPPVLDPLLSWANEAHWSMGGLSFKRLRLQGRIEGNVQKLRKQREKILKKTNQSVSPIKDLISSGKIFAGEKNSSESPSPPVPPLARKRRLSTLLVVEDDEEEERQNNFRVRKLARKLGEDFDEVGNSETVKGKNSPSGSVHGGNVESVASRTRSHRSDSEEGDDDREKLIEESKKLKSKMSMRMENEGKEKVNGEDFSVSVDGKRSSPRLLKKRNPATFLHAYTCLPLAYPTRQAAGAIVQDVADSGVLFAILMCKHKALFQDNTYGVDSGGDLKAIPELIFEEFKAPSTLACSLSEAKYCSALPSNPVGNNNHQKVLYTITPCHFLRPNRTIVCWKPGTTNERRCEDMVCGDDDPNERLRLLSVAPIPNKFRKGSFMLEGASSLSDRSTSSSKFEEVITDEPHAGKLARVVLARLS
ncbi:hypothetical protein Ancab_027499 [Ancistrocladus abbreviatus]